MSNSANIPALGNKIVVDIPSLNALLQQMIRAELANVADLPVRAKQMVEGANGWEFQQFNGSRWATLTDWNINAQQVDGHSVATGTTPNTVPVRDADGKLPGDITGNAATAREASALSEVNPIEKGGTGGATAARARQNLGVPPTSHASSGTDFGLGTDGLYGHLKSHDVADAELTAASGHALSPAGAFALQDYFASLVGGVAGDLSALDTALRAIIAEEVAKCLPLTGGVMTGRVKSSQNGSGALSAADNAGQLRFCGGNGAWSEGGVAILYGLDSPDYPSGWSLNAFNPGTNGFVPLRGFYDAASSSYKLEWGNSDVYNSSNGILMNSANVVTKTVTNGVITTAPSGGTWAYFAWAATSTGEASSTRAGTAAGGASVSAGDTSKKVSRFIFFKIA